MKALTEDLHERREKAKLGGGEEKIAKQHERGKLTARERIDLLSTRAPSSRSGIHGRPHFSQRAMEGKEAPADGVITGWGEVDGRRCCDRRLRLHRDGRLDGDDRRAQGRPPARDGAAASGCRSSGCSTRPARASRRRPARCSPARATSSARRSMMSGVIPHGRGDDGPLRRRHRLHPGLSDFVPMVVGPGRDGARRAAPDQGRHRRGHHRWRSSAARRSTAASPASATSRCKDDAGVHRGDQGLPLLLPVQLRGEAAGARRPTTRSTAMSEELLDIVPESPRSPTTCTR